jgi:hypothetical protein
LQLPLFELKLLEPKAPKQDDAEQPFVAKHAAIGSSTSIHPEENWRRFYRLFEISAAPSDIPHISFDVYPAAKASTADMEECWRRCRSWLTLTWKGKMSPVIEDDRRTTRA